MRIVLEKMRHDDNDLSSSTSGAVMSSVIYRGSCSIIQVCQAEFKIVMLCRRQTIFSTPYFQFENKFYFLFVNNNVKNTHEKLLCFPSWHHGKQRILSWKSHGILL